MWSPNNNNKGNLTLVTTGLTQIRGRHDRPPTFSGRSSLYVPLQSDPFIPWAYKGRPGEEPSFCCHPWLSEASKVIHLVLAALMSLTCTEHPNQSNSLSTSFLLAALIVLLRVCPYVLRIFYIYSGQQWGPHEWFGSQIMIHNNVLVLVSLWVCAETSTCI